MALVALLSDLSPFLVGRFVGFDQPDTIATFDADGSGRWDAKGPTSGGLGYLVQVSFRWTLEDRTTLTLETASGNAGPFGCAAGVVGRYAVQLDAKNLVLTLAEDGCGPRARALRHVSARRGRRTASEPGVASLRGRTTSSIPSSSRRARPEFSRMLGAFCRA
jgi:hypothetical protein